MNFDLLGQEGRRSDRNWRQVLHVGPIITMVFLHFVEHEKAKDLSGVYLPAIDLAQPHSFV